MTAPAATQTTTPPLSPYHVRNTTISTMATTPITTSTSISTGSSATKAASANLAKRGNNRQPARQAYKVYRPSKTVKRWTETLKGYLKVQKLSPEQRGAIAFFTLQPERNAN